MARNSEKAQAMLNRWTAMKRGELGGERIDDPEMATTVSVCMRWRNGIIKKISRNALLIQNESLGEHKLRHLNNEINELIKDKEKWEDRIIVLNGPNYKSSKALTDGDGTEVLHLDGFYYFGAAKSLPEVKEMKKKKSIIGGKAGKLQKMRLIAKADIEYFGFVPNEKELLRIEINAEKKEREKINQNWNEIQEKKKEFGKMEDEEDESCLDEDMYIPTQSEIQKSLNLRNDS